MEQVAQASMQKVGAVTSATYTAFASAWNDHTDSIDIKAAAALVAGCLLGVVALWLIDGGVKVLKCERLRPPDSNLSALSDRTWIYYPCSCT
jgi:hypothetical protein